MTALSGQNILCFANDWSTDPTSKHHLLKQYARSNRVLWIESAGMRTPNLGSTSDLGRIAGKLRSFTKEARPALPNLQVYTPPSIPLPGNQTVAKLNAALYRSSIGRQLRRIGMTEAPIAWVYAPHVAPLIRNIPSKGLVYHCVDKWSAFAGYDRSFMERCEQELCERADVVVASAADLAERCARYSNNVHYVPHGVDHAHFARALEPGVEPEDLAGIASPRVGFFGLIHEWVDVDLIGHLADSLPYQFVLIGATDQDLSALVKRSNVHFLGRKPFGTLPDYSRGFDAAIVPFRVSELTTSVNPIKLREYAAAGLPVVSTGLPEVLKCADIVLIANNREEWVEKLTQAVAFGSDISWRRSQSERVRGDDWSGVSERIGALVSDALGKGKATA